MSTINHRRHTLTRFTLSWEYWSWYFCFVFFLTDTASVQHHVRGSQPSSPWPGGSALSYANTDLTSAVRSKQGRGTLEPSLPPPRLTHPDLFLCPAHSLSYTHPLPHTHHAYLSGAPPPPRAGFYLRVWLITTRV